MPLPDVAVDVRRVAERDDARVVHHLVEEHDVVRGLQDVEVGVVAREQVRHADGDAALLEPPVGVGRTGIGREVFPARVGAPLRLGG